MQSTDATDPAARYINLVTFRRDGREVATPVWCVGLDGRLYVGTHAGTGKAKRIRATGRARWAVCNANGSRLLGPWREGPARIVTDTALAQRAAAALRRKYGWQWLLAMAVYRLRGWYGARCVLELTAAAGDEPA